MFYLIIYISTNIYACSVSLYCCLLEFLQYPLPGAHVSYQVKTNVPLSFTPLPSSETPASLWPRQDDSIAHFNNSDLVSPTPNVVDNNVSCLAPISLQRDVGPLDNLVHRIN